MRQRIWQILKYLLALMGILIIYSILFQVIMVRVEGEQHSWVTALYWTLMVMSTLGFGDVAFQSDIGRIFTIVVLTTGVIQLMILIPIVFIRFAPWLERVMRIKPPRSLPESISNHVIITSYESVITPGLLSRFEDDGIPAFVIQADNEKATQQHLEGLHIVAGEPDETSTYDSVRVQNARMVIVNDIDTENANSILTIREVAPDVPIVALAQFDQSVDVLELSGANHVLPLKRWLGEQLANRASSRYSPFSEVGQFEGLRIVELPVFQSAFANRTVRDTRLRELTGVSIVGVWDGSLLKAIDSDLRLLPEHVLVLAGTDEQLGTLGNEVAVPDANLNPVLIIGGGRVGIAATRRLQEKKVPVYIVEKDPALRERLQGVCDRVFIGDAAEYEVLYEAGILNAPSVIITTNDDAVNIYLSSYCRHLNKKIRIVSRITHERNLEAVHRAGADLVLRYGSLGVEAIMATIENRSLLLLGENIQLFKIETPTALVGKTLYESGIGADTGMIVLAIQKKNEFIANPPKSVLLVKGAILFVLGSTDQRDQFKIAYRISD